MEAVMTVGKSNSVRMARPRNGTKTEPPPERPPEPQPDSDGGGARVPPKAPPGTSDDGDDPSSGARTPEPTRAARTVRTIEANIRTEIDLANIHGVSPHYSCANCGKPYPDAVARDPEPHTIWEMLRIDLKLQENWYTRTLLFCGADCVGEYDGKRKKAAELLIGRTL